MLGLSIILGVKRVLDADPDRADEVLVDEAAGLAMDLLLPGTGPIGTYATQTARGELKTLSLLFPTVYTWILDAYLGDILEEGDPEGARYIRRSMETPWGQVDLMRRLFGGY